MLQAPQLGVALLVASVCCAWLPFGAGPVAEAFLPAELALDQAAGLFVWGSLAASLLLFFPAALVLGCVGLPSGKPGIFFYGPEKNSAGVGDGTLCIGGVGIKRLPVVITSSAGTATWDLDVADAGLSAGQTVHFQFWYRDPGGGPTGSNLSIGLGALFCQ